MFNYLIFYHVGAFYTSYVTLKNIKNCKRTFQIYMY